MGVSGVRPVSVRPSDKKEGREIDSFKGNLSKNVKFQKYSAKSIVFQLFWIQKRANSMRHLVPVSHLPQLSEMAFQNHWF